MHVSRFITMAERLMEEFDVDHWNFQMNNHMRHFGITYFDEKLIAISTPLVELNSVAAARDTMLHEIAHALAGPRAAEHGPRWKRIATEIGATPVATFDPDEHNIPSKWVATCPKCSFQWKFDRKMDRLCDSCNASILWEPTRYHLTAMKAAARRK